MDKFATADPETLRDGRIVAAPGRRLRRPKPTSKISHCRKKMAPLRGQGAGQGHLDCELYAVTTEACRRSMPCRPLMIS
jgi:hypothetical protein